MNILLLSSIGIVLYCIFVYFLSSLIVSKLTDEKPTVIQVYNVKDFCIILKVLNIILGVLFFIMLGLSMYYFYKNTNKTLMFNVIKFGFLLMTLTIVNVFFVQSIENVLNSSDNIDLQKSKILATNDSIQKTSMFTAFLVILSYQFYVCNPSALSSLSSLSSSSSTQKIKSISKV